MLTFESPGYLTLLVLVPILIYFRHFSPSSGQALRVSTGIWRKSVVSIRQNGLKILLFISTLIFWSGFLILLTALSGPALSIHEKVYVNRGSDIIIVLDQSPSMAARDFPPETRLDSAINMIKLFVAPRKSDAVGLVGFGQEAVLKVPPTTDYKSLIERLESSRIMEFGEGTAIGMGLAVAVLHLSESRAEKRVIVLITDGDNNAGEIQPAAAAAMASQMGIRLYTIGIGGEGEVSFEFTDPENGSLVSGVLNSRFDEVLLRDLAETGGGSFFKASTPGTLESVFRSIDTLETTEERVRIHVRTEPLYRWFIFIGLALVFMDLFIRKLLFREVL